MAVAWLIIVDVLIGSIGLYLLHSLLTRPPTARRVPPGPKGWPFIGNLFDIPTGKEWLTFDKWGRMPMVSIFGRHTLIINNYEDAVELLDSRSAIYSDRPAIPMAEMVGWQNSTTLAKYGAERLRVGRKLFHRTMGMPAAVKTYHPVQEEETFRFIKRLVADPENLRHLIRMTSSAIILRVAYGYRIKEKDDPFVALAEEATAQFGKAVAPGSFIVNMIPALEHYYPEWLPGGGFHKTAREWGQTTLDLVNLPIKYVREQIALGTAEKSVSSTLLEENPDQEDEEHIKWTVMSMYGAASETTYAAIWAFFKAMVLYPEVQKKAQAEIDSIISSGRLPNCADRDNLPYLNALTLEVYRWHVSLPNGIPHRLMEDDYYNGYFIPKGTTILTNLWRMAYDPDEYPQPATFDPHRHLGPHPARDPRNIIFGFGRRICTGKLLADSSVFLSCAMTLAVFNILPHVENGMPIFPEVDHTGGTLSHPSPFKCRIEARSQAALDLIHDAQYE